MRPLLSLLLLPLLAAVAAADSPNTDAAACLAEYKQCSSLCRADRVDVPHERTCRTGCARTSALCQRATPAPLGAINTALNVATPSNFAFTDTNGERFLPFGFYQYTVTKELDKRLPGEEAMHGERRFAPVPLHDLTLC